MRPQQIKSKLIARGIRQADIARELEVTRGAVNRTITGGMISERIQYAISVAINTPQKRVFPPVTKK